MITEKRESHVPPPPTCYIIYFIRCSFDFVLDLRCGIKKQVLVAPPGGGGGCLPPPLCRVPEYVDELLLGAGWQLETLTFITTTAEFNYRSY